MLTYYNDEVPFEILQGKTLTKIDSHSKEELYFYTTNNEVFRMFHERDCCESVTLDDVCGDLNDLIDSQILLAEEVSDNNDGPLEAYEVVTTFTYNSISSRRSRIV